MIESLENLTSFRQSTRAALDIVLVCLRCALSRFRSFVLAFRTIRRAHVGSRYIRDVLLVITKSWKGLGHSLVEGLALISGNRQLKLSWLSRTVCSSKCASTPW